MAEAESTDDFEAIAGRLDRTLAGVRSVLEPAHWERVEDAIRLVTELYGQGLARIVEAALGTADSFGSELVDRLAADPVVGGLLILHDLHPGDLARRVEVALDGIRPYLNSHGGDVEVLGVDAVAHTVRVRLLGSCDGCPSSSVTLRDAVERAVMEAAPDVATIEVEGFEPPVPQVPATPVALGVKPEPAGAGAGRG